MAKVNPNLKKKSLSPELLKQMQLESQKYDPLGSYTGSSAFGEPQQDGDDI